MTEFKSPKWEFITSKKLEDFYIPDYELVYRLIESIERYIVEHPGTSDLKTIFHFLVLKKLLKYELKSGEKIFDLILKCEFEERGLIGFKSRPSAKEERPTLDSTFYALSSLELMGKLNFYLSFAIEEERLKKIRGFILKLQKGDHFAHCLDKCVKCKDRERLLKSIFFALQVLGMVKFNIATILPKVLPSLERRVKKTDLKRVFRILCATILDKKSILSEEEVREIIQNQTANGGFNYSNREESVVSETFWTVLALDASKWLLDFPKGKISKFVLSKLDEITPTSSNFNGNSDLVMYLSRLLSILSYIWEPFVGDLELVLFEKFGDGRVVDLEILSEQGVEGIEDKVIDYINSKYKFHLHIVDNEIQLRQYLRNLNHKRAWLARELIKSLENSSLVDLKRLLIRYNLGKLRRDWATLDDVNYVINSLVQHHFIRGSIEKRRKLFRTSHTFHLKKVIKKTLNVDNPISYQAIAFERERLLEVKTDVMNFTSEMMRSRNNIMREVESLILVEEVDLARQRMKVSIKNALFDAQFFNKNVEKFREEFEFINVDRSLRDDIASWERVYGNLRESFNDIESILSRKIEEVERVQKEKEDLWNLDELVKASFKKFKEESERLRSTPVFKEENPGGVELEEFQGNFERIANEFNRRDEEIRKKTQAITSIIPQTKARLKEIIDYWLEAKNQIESNLKGVQRVLDCWGQRREDIRLKEERVTNEIEFVKARIDALLSGENANIEKIKTTFHEELNRLVEGLRDFSADLLSGMKNELRAVKIDYRVFERDLVHRWEEAQQRIEDRITVMRSNFETRLALKVERTGLMEFQKFVDGKIKYFQQCLGDLKYEIKKDVNEVKDAVKILNLHIDEHLNNFRNANEEYKAILSKSRREISGFDQLSKMTQLKWSSFTTHYEDNLADLRKNGLRYITRQELVRATEDLESYKISLRVLSGRLKMPKSDLEGLLTGMISEGLISGRIVVAEDIVEVFNEYYHNTRKLRSRIEKMESNMSVSFLKINRLFNKSVETGNILSNADEIERRILVLREQIDSFLTQAELYSLQLGFQKTAPISREIMGGFEATVNSYRENLEKIQEKIKKARKLDGYMGEKIDFLRNLVDSNTKMLLDQIHEGGSSMSRPKISGELRILEKNINSVERDVKIYCKKLWKDSRDFDILLPQIKKTFYVKKQQILVKLSQSREMIQEEFSRKVNQKLREKFEDLLDEKIEKLNEYLGRIQVYVLRKIATNEFKTASENLTKRIAEFKSFFDKTQSEIRKSVRGFDKQYKGFSVKNQYLLDRWSRFTEEFTQTIREKVVFLQSEILENFLKIAIRAFKNDLVMLSFISAELGMKKQEVKERIITLIGHGNLAGKYDPDLDVYFEDPEALEKLDPETLEFMNFGNYKVQMFVKRFKVLAKQYSPILALIGSSFTIIWYLFLFTGADLVFFLVPLIILASLLYGVYNMKKKEKKIVEGIEEESEPIS
ncbi:MAG: hypothetical protein ACTSU5_15940 [Promethearchaeota archaeon]